MLPFLVTWATGAGGGGAHQAASAALLALLCLACARERAWLKGVLSMALAFAAHSAVVVAAVRASPDSVGPLVPGGPAYWQKQINWIKTGHDPEYQLRTWVPAHLQLLGGAAAYSYGSFGALTFYQGFYEVDLMNFYTAQLSRHSRSPAEAVGLGWHLWSLLRGVGYLFITFEAASLSLQRLSSVSLSSWRARGCRLAVGLGFILADGVAKAMLSETLRSQLNANLQ
jgi:hypothetical protein